VTAPTASNVTAATVAGGAPRGRSTNALIRPGPHRSLRRHEASHREDPEGREDRDQQRPEEPRRWLERGDGQDRGHGRVPTDDGRPHQLGAAGLLVLTQIAPGSSYGLLIVGYLLFGISLGLVYAPMSTAAMAAMPRSKVGIASGVLAMDRIVAGALALAATGAIFHTLRGDGDGFTAAIAGSTWLLVGLGVLGAALAWAFVRDSDRPVPPPHSHHHRFHL